MSTTLVSTGVQFPDGTIQTTAASGGSGGSGSSSPLLSMPQVQGTVTGTTTSTVTISMTNSNGISVNGPVDSWYGNNTVDISWGGTDDGTIENYATQYFPVTGYDIWVPVIINGGSYYYNRPGQGNLVFADGPIGGPAGPILSLFEQITQGTSETGYYTSISFTTLAEFAVLNFSPAVNAQYMIGSSVFTGNGTPNYLLGVLGVPVTVGTEVISRYTSAAGANPKVHYDAYHKCIVTGNLSGAISYQLVYDAAAVSEYSITSLPTIRPRPGTTFFKVKGSITATYYSPQAGYTATVYDISASAREGGGQFNTIQNLATPVAGSGNDIMVWTNVWDKVDIAIYNPVMGAVTITAILDITETIA